MTIQELRQHQIVVQDPAIDRTEYDAVMQRLRELGEEVDSSQGELDWPNSCIYFEPVFFEEWGSKHFTDTNNRYPLTFDQFMNLEIEK